MPPVDQRSSNQKVDTYYTRPKGVMGGPCLHCGCSQPEHVGLTCNAARAKRGDRRHDASKIAVLEGTLNTVKDLLSRMIHSSEVYTDDEGIVTAYKIKTGALHRLIGQLSLSVPVNLPAVTSPVPSTWYCPNCKSENHEQYKACYSCGDARPADETEVKQP